MEEVFLVGDLGLQIDLKQQIAQLLGHKDVRTTIAYYAELDTLSAGRQFDAFLEAERSKARLRGRRS